MRAASGGPTAPRRYDERLLLRRTQRRSDVGRVVRALLAERDAFRQRSNDPERTPGSLLRRGSRLDRGAMGWVAAADRSRGRRSSRDGPWIECGRALPRLRLHRPRLVPTAAWRGWAAWSPQARSPPTASGTLSASDYGAGLRLRDPRGRPILGMDGTYRAERPSSNSGACAGSCLLPTP